MLNKGLGCRNAFEILSIDIADIDIGKNIGAVLQMDQAQAIRILLRLKLKKVRAMAVASEQEMKAKAQEAKGKGDLSRGCRYSCMERLSAAVTGHYGLLQA